MLHTRCIPAFEDNYIWLVSDPDSSCTAIIDPGDAEPVLKAVEKEGLAPRAILITHHHGDHTGGIEALVKHYSIPVYGPAREQIPHLTHPVKEGDTVSLEDGIQLRVLDTPGHTAAHVCYVGNGSLFCGDTLFTAGCGRLFEGTARQMHDSLQKIAALPDNTLVYCAHEYTLANLAFAAIAEPGNDAVRDRIKEAKRMRARGIPTVPAPLSLEKQTNPFLRTAIPDLIVAAERFASHSLPTGAEVFAAVRRWKDSLD